MKTELTVSFLIILLAAGQAQAADITVDGSMCTLGDAVTAANNDVDEGYCIGNGIYGDDIITLSTNVTLAGPLPEITSIITIEGQGYSIDGNDSTAVGTVLRISPIGDLTLNETIVTRGNAPIDAGGGIYNEGTLTLSNSMVSGNTALYGGGICNFDGTVTLTDSTVNGNMANDGGGGIDSHFGTVTLTNSMVSGNIADGICGGIGNSLGMVTLTNITVSGNTAAYSSGGINNEDGTVILTNITVSGNTAAYSSGGINNEDGTVILTNTTVSGNTVTGNMPFSTFSYGGGIGNDGGTVTLINSTVSGNSVSSPDFAYGGGIRNDSGTVTLTSPDFAYGGGIRNDSGTVTLTNSTVSGNTANDSGGGIYNALYDGGTVILHSSLISGNTAYYGNEVVDNGGTITAASFNLFGHSSESNSDAFDGFTPGSSDSTATSDGADPTALGDILAPLANNGGPTETHALIIGSPAIDLDTECSAGLNEDQRGEARPNGSGCDAGSFEGSIDLLNSTFLPAVYMLLL
ncbi:MAG: choice-of-anchor Q domain-containing protein [Candidatus Electrothrix sp. GW3-4]|uniref:choice-of-anchor Q domain-containing protein n=1 Tax=Candidatus Electrothrix sp. GW3-4 TaxID=3126740 RepID=UPI0030CF656E